MVKLTFKITIFEFDMKINFFLNRCLQNCLIDVEILSMKNIELYTPEENKSAIDCNKTDKKKTFNQKYMVSSHLYA